VRDDHTVAALRAQQAGERAITTGALDQAGVDATTGALPFESEREERARVELAAVPGERARTQAAAETLLTVARNGGHVKKSRLAQTNSVDGVRHELGVAVDRLERARSEHEESLDVLAGSRPARDGTVRVGHLIAPHATPTPWLLARSRVVASLPLVVPLAVEGTAVAFNMHAYLHAADSNLLLPIGIAVITVCILTFAPYVIGIHVNNVAHGLRLSIVDRITITVLAVFWVGVGVTLALVRTTVDHGEAADKVKEEHQAAVRNALAHGNPESSVTGPNIDDYFNPLLTAVFWVVVFVGFGVVLVVFERLHRNPERMHELALRVAVHARQRLVTALTDQLAQLTASVEAQEKSNASSLAMWDAEPDLIKAAAAHDVVVYHRSLGEASGEPDMHLAIERHRAERARRAAEVAAESAGAR